MAGLVKMPCSKSIFQAWKVFILSPIMMGIIGVWLSPVSNPISRNPFLILWVFSQSRFLLSGSARIISRAAMTVATAAGGMLAEKMSARELCFM